MQLLKTDAICQKIYDNIMSYPIEQRQIVHLAAILVGHEAASLRFIEHKRKQALKLGYQFSLVHLDINSTKHDIILTITQLNKNQEITGIILQLPLPNRLHAWEITKHIAPHKDIDCLNPVNMGAFFTGAGRIYPGTAKAIELICQHYDIDIKSKRVLILGDSNLVGKPAAFWCLLNKATITVCNKYTSCLQNVTEESDIIISATGKQNLIPHDWLRSHQVIFDIGIHIQKASVSGDIDCPEVREKVAAITPVPGGVGPLTVAVLMQHLLLFKFEPDTVSP
ncbi:MAG: bifunctional 5,10-methylenetetrahydrofolate dehydrogenase/5,10-methenyltetrahydrofolate cyclohydrolase [Gammaproteobacteria bacterium]|nr:bifunctional 5,10-methylenetetrahydrofolate dehydrogenase/5,10-methenyltetrahydrofolate cyclohydrolase [Gammaproteobacteria bacterium]